MICLKGSVVSLENLTTVQSQFSDTFDLHQKLSLNLKNDLCKIIPKLQVVTEFNVTKSRLHCTKIKTNVQKFYKKRPKLTGHAGSQLLPFLTLNLAPGLEAG